MFVIFICSIYATVFQLLPDAHFASYIAYKSEIILKMGGCWLLQEFQSVCIKLFFSKQKQFYFIKKIIKIFKFCGHCLLELFMKNKLFDNFCKFIFLFNGKYILLPLGTVHTVSKKGEYWLIMRNSQFNEAAAFNNFSQRTFCTFHHNIIASTTSQLSL